MSSAFNPKIRYNEAVPFRSGFFYAFFAIFFIKKPDKLWIEVNTERGKAIFLLTRRCAESLANFPDCSFLPPGRFSH